MCAAVCGHLGVVKYLIKAKADVNTADEDGNTALIWAAKEGSLEIVKYLIETAKVDINAKDNNENTALMWAARNKHSGIEEYLKSYIKKELWQKYICVSIGGAIGLALGMAIAYHAGAVISLYSISYCWSSARWNSWLCNYRSRKRENKYRCSYRT